MEGIKLYECRIICYYCDYEIPDNKETYLGESDLAFCEDCIKIIK